MCVYVHVCVCAHVRACVCYVCAHARMLNTPDFFSFKARRFLLQARHHYDQRAPPPQPPMPAPVGLVDAASLVPLAPWAPILEPSVDSCRPPCRPRGSSWSKPLSVSSIHMKTSVKWWTLNLIQQAVSAKRERRNPDKTVEMR